MMKTLDPATTTTAAVDAEFELDLRVITDITPAVDAGCNTDDGCAATCASSCVSNV